MDYIEAEQWTPGDSTKVLVNWWYEIGSQYILKRNRMSTIGNLPIVLRSNKSKNSNNIKYTLMPAKVVIDT